jgi:hypothetical protein
MSLRIFHIVFVVVTTLTSLYVAIWGLRQFAETRNTMGLILALIFIPTAIALVVYGRKVFVKLKELP